MLRKTASGPSSIERVALATSIVLLGFAAGCEGDRGPAGAPGTTAGSTVDTALDPGEEPPGVNVAITSITGGSGPNGNFRVGDRITVRFTLKMDDNTDWDIDELESGRILVSGPTFNYQRVIAQQSDLIANAVENSDGSYSYTFADPIPATYLAPLNDTPSFDADDGELTGQALLDGTYTVGLYIRWSYTVDGEGFRDVGDATADFLFGSSATMLTRAVVGQDNCNQCHVDLQAHGGSRRNVTLCLLCHTAGSEDRNVPGVAGGTPGASIDFKIMIHRIHAGKHLPSVNGVATLPGGARDYGATPQPYQLVGFNNTVHDYSDVGFPVWPQMSFALPRDMGYSGLPGADQAKEDLIRTGPSDCNVCHGDPDGAGPIVAPAQGNLAYSQPTRAACGSCHDDVDWDESYTANGSTMLAQNDDATCTLCHEVTGVSPIDVIDGHLHPLQDPAVNPGLNFALTSVDEAGTNDGDGTIDPGEKIALTFTMTDDNGLDVDPMDVASISSVVSGPTENMNLVLNANIPPAALMGAQPYVLNLPEQIYYEIAGTATGGADVFATARVPHWNVAGANTQVFEVMPAAGGNSTLSSMGTALDNFIDVNDATNFDRDDYVVIDAGGGFEEYLQIQWVDGNRLWFSSPATSSYAPGLINDHMTGAAVTEVAFTELTEGVDWSVDEMTGAITELAAAWTDGATILTSYVTDFVLPSTYPLTLNDGPDLDETDGKWVGKSLVDGTYTVGLWGYRSLSLMLHGETNSYRGSAPSVSADFLVGSATTVEPYDLISSADSCNACHQDLWFHGGTRRGWESCKVCHAAVATGDRPRYVAANAPETAGVSISFRTMLHKIHMGEELANASSYIVNGFGVGYPNNFTSHSYDEVVFPAFPAGTMDCATCHGSSEAWIEPADRNHPTEQGQPVLAWGSACGSCHDSNAVQAHIALQTDSVSGFESCEVCHGEGEIAGVEFAHQVR